MFFNNTGGLSAVLTLFACVSELLARDSSLNVLPQVKLVVDRETGQGVTFKTIDSDDHVDHFDYAIADLGQGKDAPVDSRQSYPFGVFFKNSANQRVHTVVSLQASLLVGAPVMDLEMLTILYSVRSQGNWTTTRWVLNSSLVMGIVSLPIARRLESKSSVIRSNLNVTSRPSLE